MEPYDESGASLAQIRSLYFMLVLVATGWSCGIAFVEALCGLQEHCKRQHAVGCLSKRCTETEQQ
jgi:hypothetical protein